MWLGLLVRFVSTSVTVACLDARRSTYTSVIPLLPLSS